MAELRRVTYSNGNHPDILISGEEAVQNGSVKHHGYKKSSYELKQIHEAQNVPDKGTTSCTAGLSNNSPAIVIRNASKHYTKGVPVLQNFNMTVKRGAIYSLLGSSGSGKTTTLQCIVGVRKVNDGRIYVFDAKPGTKGKLVGYMPQETSLYGDFSIAETLSYFGTLCGLDKEAATKGTEFLTKLLRLPKSSRRVGTLSGGQRRRVSFAVALIHEPELLILDEPTVGVDPLLRESIWNHLVHLSTQRGTTVLITTHYIDEAKESTCIGVMRFGRLLVEQDPSVLLQTFNTSSLENVVLQLCRKDVGSPDEVGVVTPNTKDEDLSRILHDVESPPDNSNYELPVQEDDRHEQLHDSVKRIKALMHKNLATLFRNLLLFLFSAITPAFIIWIMCIAFQDDPKDLSFGVVNLEVPNNTICAAAQGQVTPGECDVENLSCKYIEHLPQGILSLEYFRSKEDAAAAVRIGSLWGYIMFPENFSSNFYERAAGGANVDEDVFHKSEIVVNLDQTNNHVVNQIRKTLHDGFEDFGKAILKDCGFDERQAEFALHYDNPIFGEDNTKFINFIAPSVSVAWVFFFPIIAASHRYINEKKQGTYDRSLVAGTKTWEILFAYSSTECIVLAVQSITAYLILHVLVGIEVLGSPILVILLLLLSGFGGVSMGLFIGSLCNEEIEAALLAMALFFPNCFVSGIIWPLEGMPLVLQYIAYGLPCTLTSEAMRSLFSRGWPLSHPNVWLGFVSILGYILLYLTLTVVVQKLKRK